MRKMFADKIKDKIIPKLTELKKSPMVQLLQTSIKYMQSHAKIFGIAFAGLFILQMVQAWCNDYSANSTFINFLAVTLAFLEVIAYALVPFWLYRYFFEANPPHPFDKKLYFPFLKFLLAILFLQGLSFALIETMGLIQTQLSDFTGMIFLSRVVTMILKIVFPLYVITRLNLFLPLIALKLPLKFKKRIKVTHDIYREWLVVILVIYFPSVILIEYLSSAAMIAIVKYAFELLGVAFWINYYKQKDLINV